MQNRLYVNEKDRIMTVLPILKIALTPFSASGDVNVKYIWQDNFQTGSGSIYGMSANTHVNYISCFITVQ